MHADTSRFTPTRDLYLLPVETGREGVKMG
jgi:hypothetical protein